MIRLCLLPLFTLLMAFAFMEYSKQPVIELSKETFEIVYPEHLTGAFTGGFEEETCHSCHFDYDLNPDEGNISVSGIPKNISSSSTIVIQISVERPELDAAGFQLSARHEDGRQAGSFTLSDKERTMFSKAVPDSVQYVQHTNEGANPSNKNTHSWTVKWAAPESLKEPVVFNIAANAANGDQSEFGDFIYVRELKMYP